MKNNRTQYTKYREKLKRLVEEYNMGDFLFVEDIAFNKYGEYFVKTIKKDGVFKLYRYESMDREYELDLKNIYLTKNGLQNDVFEGIPYSDGYDSYSQDECVEKLSDIAYLKCFSETFTNNLMWAHYADSYKGVCIEYDICQLDDENLIRRFFPVRYSQKRDIYASIELLVDYINGKKELNATADAQGIFLSKADFWKYEREWRICKMNHSLSKNENIKTPFDCISAIYMGPRIRPGDIEKITEKLNEYNNQKNKTRLYKMKMPKDNSYNLTCEVYNY